MLLLKRTNNYKRLRNIIEDCVEMIDINSPSMSQQYEVTKFLAAKLIQHQNIMDGGQIPQDLVTTDYASSSDGESLSYSRQKKKLGPLTHAGISEQESRITPSDFPRPIVQMPPQSKRPLNSGKSKDFHNVQSWVQKINSRQKIVSKEIMPKITLQDDLIPKLPAKITIDTPLPIMTKQKLIQPILSKARPNGSVRRIKSNKSTLEHKFGIDALLSATTGSVLRTK